MILRFIAENITSFKDCVEFNTFPSSKSHSHENHKVVCNHATALRMSAIYGANGAGKSNLIDLLAYLRTLMLEDGTGSMKLLERTFKFDKECKKRPSGLAIEFFTGGNVFYYHIEFDDEKILLEEFLLSKKTKDIEIFVRKDSTIKVNDEFCPLGYNQMFEETLKRLLRPNMLFLAFMGKYYPEEIPMATNAYNWFVEKLCVISPTSYAKNIPHLLHTDSRFAELVNSLIPEFKTGILRLDVHTEEINEESAKGDFKMERAIALAKQFPGTPQEYYNKVGEIVNIVYENGTIYLKSLVSYHQSENCEVEMNIRCESDGTLRLIDYLPLFYDILKGDKVYVVDEIESSIHPILIKSLMGKLSESTDARGQLIFSTHESALLDQSIFRPDEIWFAQKDTEQATQLYPLSDYNIHKTANIENGYLNGRYGGIPFLSNLKDLRW